MANLKTLPAPLPIDDFSGWIDTFTQATVLLELLVIGVVVVVAWGLVAALRRAMAVSEAGSIWFGERVVDGVLFPAVLLCLGFLTRELLGHFVSIAVFRVLIPVLIALVVIRVGVKVLQATFAQARWVRPLEQTISWIAWIAMVLWVSGLLPAVLNELDQVSWKVGGTTLSVRNIIEGMVTAGGVLIITLWISSGIESRLLRSATGGELSLRKAASNAVRAVLMFVGVMMALSAVGIDLTALSVIGGAVGVGIGLGLQKLAANYVSGFVILTERSMRIGDTVHVDGFEGQITQINARYTVLRSLNGRESIVPNEMMITQRVENLSLADSKVSQAVSVTVGYDSDVGQVMALLMEAALAQPRVLREPAPLVMLAHFGADGLEFSMNYWIDDLDKGSGNLRSDINLAILRLLRENSIEIPYPQRVVHNR
jgi:small-conductance mechanosensitive channel